MCAKLISPCLQASRNKRCNLQAPWTSIYLVLLLLLPPHGCLSHFSHLSWDEGSARGFEPDPTSAVTVLPAGAPGGAVQPAPQALPACITTPYTHPHWTGAAIYLLNRKSSTAMAFFFCPRCCVLTQGHKRKITSSDMHSSNLYTGNSPCLLL